MEATRFDLYKSFEFRVRWEGRYVAGVRAVSELRRAPEVVTHREGGDPGSTRKSPEYEAIMLERGVTHDSAFEDWANKLWTPGGELGAEVSLDDFRRDIRIDVFDEGGQLVIAYRVFRCWVSEFQAMPNLDEGGVAIQHLKLENEGWEPDQSVREPSEPSRPGPA